MKQLHLRSTYQLQPGEYPYHEEQVAADQTIAFDLGLGTGLLRTWVGQQDILAELAEILVDYEPGLYNFRIARPNHAEVEVYAWRQGKRCDIGLAEDFESLSVS